MSVRTVLAHLTQPLRAQPTLPLRAWLVLAVVAITGAGFLAQVGLVAPVNAWQQQAEDARLAQVRQVLGSEAAHWRDPAWQRRADASLAALGVEVAIFPATTGSASSAPPSAQAIFMTPGALQFLGAGASGTANTQASTATQVSFARLAIAGSGPGTARAPVGVALVWDTVSGAGGAFGLLWTIVEWGTFLLTLAIVLWLIGQPVLRPLAALSAAVADIADGDLRVHLPHSPVREIADAGSALEGMSAALRDSLAQQHKLEQERRMFVGAIAHDLRTPLFMLRGYLKGLESGVADNPEKMAHYVAVCQTQADALERMVSDLFAYTRLEHLELEPEREPLDLGALLRHAVDAADSMAVAKRITLSLDIAPGGAAITGDQHLLERAIGNLLDNAVRHTPEGGAIRVRLARTDGQLTFTVEDSGPGLDAKDLPHLFTPLYRGEASRNRQTSGAGLGLATAKRILEAHGGTLTAANRAQGGAIFTGTVPAARQPAVEAAVARA